MTRDRWNLDPTSLRVTLSVLRHGPISRAELGRLLGLSSASLTRITEPLVRTGLLLEGTPQPRSPGRPALPLEIAAGAATFLGVKLTREAVHGVLTDLKGTVLRGASWPLPDASPATVVATVAQAAHALRGRRRPRALGVSLAGTVAADGLVRSTRLLGWGRPVDLAGMLSETTDLAVVIDNDVNAFAVAEHWFGAGRGYEDFAVLTLGAGVELGIVAGDELVRGHGGAAGMVGPVLLGGGRCAADAAGVPALVAATASRLGRSVTAAELPALAGRDAELAAGLDALAAAAGQLAGTVSAVLAPARILIAGEGAVALDGRHDLVAAQLDAMSPDDLPAPELVVAAIGEDAWARGAAALAIRATMRG